MAIIDKLLEYECITPSQHQNMHSALCSPSQNSSTLICLWIKDLVISISIITNPVPTPIFIFQSIYCLMIVFFVPCLSAQTFEFIIKHTKTYYVPLNVF